MTDMFDHNHRLLNVNKLGVRKLRGTGILETDVGRLHGRFELVHLVHRGPMVEFAATDDNALSLFMRAFTAGHDVWSGASLCGVLDDNDSSVTVNGFAGAHGTTGLAPIRLALRPRREVHIGHGAGDPTDVERKYWLTSYFGPSFRVSVRPGAIVCEPSDKRRKKIRAWAGYWKLPVESALLRAKTDVGNDMEQLDSYVDQLLTLLTFVEGRRISYSRCLCKGPGGRKRESWTQRIVDPVGFENEVFYEFDVQPFLDSALPTYAAISKGMQEQIALTIYLLNAAKCTSNVEESTMLVATTWEVIADILAERSVLSPAIGELRNRLQSVLSGWKRDFPAEDKDAFYQGRVLRALDWDKVQARLSGVLSGKQLNAEKLGTDFRSFNIIRGAIVHRGCPPDGYSYSDVAILNRRMMFAADLIIMKCLGYDGAVVDRSGNSSWKTRSEMTEFQD